MRWSKSSFISFNEDFDRLENFVLFSSHMLMRSSFDIGYDAVNSSTSSTPAQFIHEMSDFYDGIFKGLLKTLKILHQIWA